MRLKLKTAPTVEPVTLEEAKLHMRVDSGDENVLITSFISTARELVEHETKRAFITQTWLMTMDKAEAVIEIPKPPLQSIVSIKAISSTETTVDETVDKDQPILSVASTAHFTVGDSIVINRDGEREEEKIILSIQTGDSLTLTTNLTFVHTAAQADKVEKYTLAETARYNVDASENSYGRVKLKTGSTWPTHRNFASFIIEFKVGYGDAAADIPAGLKEAILLLVAHLHENRGGVEIPKGIKSLLWKFKIQRI